MKKNFGSERLIILSRAKVVGRSAEYFTKILFLFEYKCTQGNYFVSLGYPLAPIITLKLASHLT